VPNLFQQHDGSKLIHHVKARQKARWVVVSWKAVGDDPVEVVVACSETGYADRIEQLVETGSTQRLVYRGRGTSAQDQGVVPRVTLNYSLFARSADGAWHLQDHVRVRTEGDWEVKAHPFTGGATVQMTVDDLRDGSLGPSYGIE
jgi:hypothetical protein